MDTVPFDRLAFSLDFARNSEIGSFATNTFDFTIAGGVDPILEPISRCLLAVAS
jgi:hypothetical protein